MAVVAAWRTGPAALLTAAAWRFGVGGDGSLIRGGGGGGVLLWGEKSGVAGGGGGGGGGGVGAGWAGAGSALRPKSWRSRWRSWARRCSSSAWSSVRRVPAR